MVDFKYMLSDKYKQKKTEKDKIIKQQEELKNKTCSFTGHRPNSLYGYNIMANDYIRLAELIRDECIRLIKNKGVARFISGGALGVDTIAFLIIHKLKQKYPDIENILAIPFKNQSCKWFNQNDIDRYEKIKTLADDIVYVDLLEDYKVKGIEDNIYHPAKMQKRNEYMVDNSSYTIAVWNGEKKGGTWNCIKYARDKGNEITRVNPKYFEVSYNL